MTEPETAHDFPHVVRAWLDENPDATSEMAFAAGHYHALEGLRVELARRSVSGQRVTLSMVQRVIEGVIAASMEYLGEAARPHSLLPGEADPNNDVKKLEYQRLPRISSIDGAECRRRVGVFVDGQEVAIIEERDHYLSYNGDMSEWHTSVYGRKPVRHGRFLWGGAIQFHVVPAVRKRLHAEVDPNLDGFVAAFGGIPDMAS